MRIHAVTYGTILGAALFVFGCNDDVSQCPSIEIQNPAAGVTLTPQDDSSGTCDDGFQTDIRVLTNAPASSEVQLFINGQFRPPAVAAGTPTVVFPRVSFDTNGTAQVEARIVNGPAGCQTPPAATRQVTVNCGTPRCSIVQPVKPSLNLSDNRSSDPAQFATQFLVQTDVEDGQPVELNIDLNDAIRGTANGGQVNFPLVALRPDGMHQARARCVNQKGIAGLSALMMYNVDSIPPTLTVVSPAANAFIPVTAPDVNPAVAGKQFQVCAKSDATGQPLSASVEGSVPDVPGGQGAVPASANDPVCVEVTCPSGPAPFNVFVSVSDPAGNQATARVQNISCASTLPSVRIIDPVLSVPGMPGTFLTVSRDRQPPPGQAGLQYTVIACSDETAGTAVLLVNDAQVGGTVTLAPANAACTALGFRSVAQFADVTLPDSTPGVRQPSDPFPDNPTLKVRVTDTGGDMGESPIVTVFVDDIAPTLAIVAPACGSILRPAMGSSSVTTTFTVSSDVVPLTLSLQHEMDPPITITGPSFTGMNIIDFPGVNLQLGHYTVTASATDVAGNSGVSPAPCTLTVGNPPAVSFMAPTNGQIFNSTGDTDHVTEGFQSTTVTLVTDAPDGSAAQLVIGSQPPLAGTVSGGMVSFGPLTLPEGDSLTLTGTVTDPTRGPGTATITVVVDTLAPNLPTSLSTLVTSRRGGRIRLSWNNAADPTGGGGTAHSVATYQVRWSVSPINDANFASATPFAYTATPGAPGSPEQAETAGLTLGVAGSRSYYLAVRAIDQGGNAGPVASTPMATALNILAVEFNEPSLSLYGSGLSGGFDVNGDHIPDLIVGSAGANEARLYLGSTSGISPTNYIRFADPIIDFGNTVVSVGDMNGDGLGDIAIGAPRANTTGEVYIYFGRSDAGATPWPRPPMSLSRTNADVTIAGSAGDFATARIGRSLTHADFNGDGLPDLVIGCSQVNNLAAIPPIIQAGAVAIVAGRSPFPAGSIALPTGAAVVIMGSVPRTDSIPPRFGTPVDYGGPMVGNDALDDILVGSNDAAADSGSFYVFAGRPFTGSTITLSSGTDNAFRHVGPAGSLQRLVHGVGDINGDGRLDMAVGAFQQPATGSALFFGNAAGSFDEGPFIRSIGDPDQLGISASNLYDGRLLHSSLFNAGSIYADLVLGSIEWMNVPGDLKIALFQGRASWTGLTGANADGLFTETVASPDITADVVAPINWIGDVDGDGYEDMAAGVYTAGRFVWIH